MLRDMIVHLLVNGKVKELEISCDRLVIENTAFREREKRLETRIANLEAAMGRIVDIFKNQWIGVEEQHLFNLCRAILEDQSWRR